MEMKILKLLFDYSYNNRLVDKVFIDKLIEIVVESKNLSQYVKNVKFTKKLEKTDSGIIIANYLPMLCRILIDDEAVATYYSYLDRYDEYLSSFEQYMYRNISIAQVILHELEHAYQHQVADDKTKKDDEAKIIRASFFLTQALKNPKFTESISDIGISQNDLRIYVLYNQELYNKFYNVNPAERLAQINSYNQICGALNDIKNQVINLYSIEQLSYFSELLKGYQESFDQGGLCPTQVYLYGMRRGSIWESFDFYHQDNNEVLTKVSEKYDFNKRLTLGLPVKSDEYSLASNWIESANNFR